MRFRSRTMEESLSVLQKINQFFGLQSFERHGEILKSISLVYAMTITALYWVLIYYGYDIYLESKVHKFERLLAAFIMYLHAIAAFILTVCGCCLSHAYKTTLRRIDKVDSTLEQLSSTTYNQRIYVMSICGVVAYLTYQVLLHYFNESFIYTENGVAKTAFGALIYIHCQNLSYCVVFTFVLLIMSLRERFKRINDLLSEITAVKEVQMYGKNIKHHSSRVKVFPVLSNNSISSWSSETNGIMGEEISNESKKVTNRFNHIIRTTKQLHLELCKTSRVLCTYFGLQLMLIMMLDVIVITNLLFSLYNRFVALEVSDTVKFRRLILTITMCVLHTSQLIILNVSCEKATCEASKTMEIIHSLSCSTDNLELKEEISQFGLQTMQRPLEFTPLGFLLLNNKFLHALGGSITTYAVILIQVGDDWLAGNDNNSTRISQNISLIEV